MPDTHNEWQNEWRTNFREKDFYTIMNDNAPITDMISYIENLLREQEASLRKEWAGKVRELKKEVKNVPHGDSNSVRRKKAFNAALKQVLALIEPEI